MNVAINRTPRRGRREFFGVIRLIFSRFSNDISRRVAFYVTLRCVALRCSADDTHANIDISAARRYALASIHAPLGHF